MDSLINFRDLGGLETRDGKRLKHKRLLRSAAPRNLSDDARKALLEEYGLKQIIDFRSTKETLEEPNDDFDGVSTFAFNIMKDAEHNWTSLEEMFRNLDNDRADEILTDINRQFILMQSAQEGYRAFFQACLAADEGATLFHCAVGKDRTGFGAALLLKALNVPDEVIYEDYLKTVAQRAEANRQVVEAARAQGLGETQLEAMATFLSVKQQYLEAAFAAIDEHYGTFDSYLQRGLGISQEDVERLKNLYLED